MATDYFIDDSEVVYQNNNTQDVSTFSMGEQRLDTGRGQRGHARLQQ